MQAMARGSWKPLAPSSRWWLPFLAVAAAEEGQCCPGGSPREADPSMRTHEAGPASDPCEAGRDTPGMGHDRPSILRHVLLLGRTPGRCARGVDRGVRPEWP